MKNPSGLFKILLGVSLFNWIYFGFLIAISQYPLTSESIISIIRFFGELFTISLSFFTVFMVVFSLIKIAQKKDVKKFLLLLIINCLTLGFLISNF